jgi:nicotinamidase-related amidase
MAHLKANVANSQLVVVDMQLKLAQAMPVDEMQTVVKNNTILLQAAHILAVPVILTEQYPKGLGDTMPKLKHFLNDYQPIAKTAFSVADEPKFIQQLNRDKSQLIIMGMEAHICVLQSAIDMINRAKTVFVVEDAIISRSPANKANGIARMRAAGCIITNTESVLFEWLGNANHEAFRAISTLIK